MMFTRLSRYRTLPDEVTTDADGRAVTSKGTRLLPQVTGTFVHTIESSDRLDYLAYEYYKQPRKWWRICDANPEFLSPQAMLGKEPVVTARFPVMFTGTGQPPWAALISKIRTLVGVTDVQLNEHIELIGQNQNVNNEIITVYTEHVEYALVVTFNRMNIDATQVADAIVETKITADHPVAYYRLNESPDATIALDWSGHGNHGTYSKTGITLGVSGLDFRNRSAHFDGLGSGRLIVPDNALLSPKQVTVEALIKWSGPNGFQQRILEKSFGPGWPTRTAYSLCIQDDGRVCTEMATHSTQADYLFSSKSALAPGTTTHVAMTYDGSVLAIYINGVLDASLPVTGDIRSTLHTSQLGIGNQVERDRPFNGLIGEVAVYDRALPADRIQAHVHGMDQTIFGEDVTVSAPEVIGRVGKQIVIPPDVAS